MSAPYTKLVTPITRLSVVCRGCLADSGEMKNMYEWGLYEDYFRVTAIEVGLFSYFFNLLTPKRKRIGVPPTPSHKFNANPYKK